MQLTFLGVCVNTYQNYPGPQYFPTTSGNARENTERSNENQSQIEPEHTLQT